METREWSRQDMYWADAKKRMLPDAKAVSTSMEIYYAPHGQIESPSGSERLLLRCDLQKYERDPIP